METRLTRPGWQDPATIGLGLALFVAGGFVLAIEPAWAVSTVGAGAALTAAGLTVLLTTVGRRPREDSTEVAVDERVQTIGQLSGYRAFQATFALQGIALAVLSFTVVDLPMTVVLGGLFALTALAYLAAYEWYRRST
ncbi:MAG: DUF2178 domain-containing protein [Halobacterium sp.]